MRVTQFEKKNIPLKACPENKKHAQVGLEVKKVYLEKSLLPLRLAWKTPNEVRFEGRTSKKERNIECSSNDYLQLLQDLGNLLITLLLFHTNLLGRRIKLIAGDRSLSEEKMQ